MAAAELARVVVRILGVSMLVLLITGARVTAYAGELIVLTYHDVVADSGSDRFATTRGEFVSHMDYLQQNGYQPISLAHLEQTILNNAPLPDKAVMLTFDDGLKSYREFIVPLLKIYEFPSVVSLVTAWLDGVDVPSEYQGKIMSWNDVRNVAASPLVSVASHTHNMHQGILANLRGNERSAASTRQYFPATHSYESETQFRERVRRDLSISLARIQKELAITTRAITWPYGEYDEVVLREASTLGITTHFVLGDAANVDLASGVVRRELMVDHPDVASFAKIFARKSVVVPRRFAEINLDTYVGKTEVEQEILLSELLDKLSVLQLSAVIVTPVTADGRRAFFSTTACELATDVFDRVVHQIWTRLNIRNIVVQIPSKLRVKDERLFFTDLARLSRFDGLLFPSDTAVDRLRIARDVVPRFRTHIKFALFGDLRLSHEYDFMLTTYTELLGKANSIVSADAARLWVSMSGVRDEQSLRDAIVHLGKQGIVNYGVPIGADAQ